MTEYERLSAEELRIIGQHELACDEDDAHLLAAALNEARGERDEARSRIDEAVRKCAERDCITKERRLAEARAELSALCPRAEVVEAARRIEDEYADVPESDAVLLAREILRLNAEPST